MSQRSRLSVWRRIHDEFEEIARIPYDWVKHWEHGRNAHQFILPPRVVPNFDNVVTTHHSEHVTVERVPVIGDPEGRGAFICLLDAPDTFWTHPEVINLKGSA